MCWRKLPWVGRVFVSVPLDWIWLRLSMQKFGNIFEQRAPAGQEILFRWDTRTLRFLKPASSALRFSFETAWIHVWHVAYGKDMPQQHFTVFMCFHFWISASASNSWDRLTTVLIWSDLSEAMHVLHVWALCLALVCKPVLVAWPVRTYSNAFQDILIYFVHWFLFIKCEVHCNLWNINKYHFINKNQTWKDLLPA